MSGRRGANRRRGHARRCSGRWRCWDSCLCPRSGSGSWGGFELRRGRERLALDSGRFQSLLAFLLLHRELPQPRQRIAFLFWPDSTEKQARTNFRNLLHILRSNLPEADGYLDIGTSAISWRPEAPVDADVVAFEEAVERAERGTGPAAVAAFEEAVRAYGGDLLPGCYDEWPLLEVSSHIPLGGSGSLIASLK